MIDHIATPWTPYGVAFSFDGTRLAIGGGAWYGFGGIAIVDLRSNERTVRSLAELHAHGGTISGLSLTPDDRHLFASTWTASRRPGSTLALQLDGLAVNTVAAHPEPNPATGIAGYGPGAIVRHYGAAVEDTLQVLEWPAELAIDRTTQARARRQHLMGHRLVVVRGHAITGNHGVSNNATGPAYAPLHPGLVLRSLATGRSSFVPAHDSAVSAIGVTEDDLVITGNLNGQLEAWAWTGQVPHRDQRLGEIPAPAEIDRALTWAVYQKRAVVGICSLCDGRMVAVTAGGMLATWQMGEPITTWQLPVRGTPRAIAASPDRLVVAIGVKQGGAPRPDSEVVLVEIDPEIIAPSWRTDRVREIARATDQQRTPSGALDTAMLGVLADALEEAGCRPRVHQHLRTHDPRLRCCWVLDELRE